MLRPQPSRNRALALGFLRTINTAEAADFSKYGSYVSWQTLLARQPEYLNAWLATYYAQERKVHFGDLPEVLPGLNLRLSVHIDGHLRCSGRRLERQKRIRHAQ